MSKIFVLVFGCSVLLNGVALASSETSYMNDNRIKRSTNGNYPTEEDKRIASLLNFGIQYAPKLIRIAYTAYLNKQGKKERSEVPYNYDLPNEENGSPFFTNRFKRAIQQYNGIDPELNERYLSVLQFALKYGPKLVKDAYDKYHKGKKDRYNEVYSYDFTPF